MNKEAIDKIIENIFIKYDLEKHTIYELATYVKLVVIFDASLNNLDGVYFNNEIILNSERPKNRQLFTLAHELGHFFIPWHCNYYGCVEYDEKNDLEREADYFASKLLMPDSGVNNLLNNNKNLANVAIEIITKYGVSLEAALRRILLISTKYLYIIYEDARYEEKVLKNFSFYSSASANDLKSFIQITCDKFCQNDYNMRNILIFDFGYLNKSLPKSYEIKAGLLESLKNKSINLIPIYKDIYDNCNNNFIFTVSIDNNVIMSYKKIVSGKNINLNNDSDYENLFSIIDSYCENEILYRIYKDNLKLHYEGSCKSGDSKTLLKHLLEKHNCKELLCSINGIISSANSSNKDRGTLKNKEDYFDVFKSRFIGRKINSELLYDPEFDDFLWLKSIELNNKWNA